MSRFPRFLLPVILAFGAFAATSAGRAQEAPVFDTGIAAPAAATAPDASHIKAGLLANRAAVAPGETFLLALTFDHPAHWHTYWKNPGDAGDTTKVAWKTTSGATFGAWRWPHPHLFAQDTILNFVYEGKAAILIPVTAPASAKPGDTLALEGEASWLECDDSSCNPRSAVLALKIPVAEKSSRANADDFAGFEKQIPAKVPAGSASLEIKDKNTVALHLSAEAVKGRDLAAARFFPDSETVPAAFVKVAPVADKDGGATFAFADAGKVAEAKKLSGVLVFKNGDSLEIAAAPAAPAGSAAVAGTAGNAGDPPTGLPLLLLLAFGGGIVLNVMPCVFPVIGLKIYGFVNKAHADRKKVVAHALVFAAGIVISFWILAGLVVALKSGAVSWFGAGGENIGWGFLQQIPVFNAAVAAVFLVMGLGMAGVFEFGTGIQNAAGAVEEREGYTGSFVSGALATLVATPCTGPLMAPALTAAFSRTAVESFAIFTALGVGLALPFVVLAANPTLMKKLPRPGAWMESFKQAMAFALFAAFAYFIWVACVQIEELPAVLILPPGLAISLAAVLLALACWIYGRWCAPHHEPRTRRTGAIVAGVVFFGTLAAAGAQLVAKAPETTSDKTGYVAGVVWEIWSPERQRAALAEGKTVYVDFTAKWCATCLVNKRVYHEDAVIRAFADGRIVALRADWTNRNETIAKELKKYDRVAIPFNVVLKSGEAPKTLPSLLTAGDVIGALGGKGAEGK